jgi:DNA-binding response OmpR family regulator
MADETYDILVVDDDRDIAELVALSLEGHGHRVRTAADAPTALALLDEAWPDLILLDLMLPATDGFELCKQVRALSPAGASIPILMLTALTRGSFKSMGFECGANDYITKPFDLQDLLARVRVWGRVSRRIRELDDLQEGWESERRAAQNRAIRLMGLAISDAVNDSLTEIYGYAELLAARANSDAELCELSDRLQQASHHLVAVVEQLAGARECVTKRYGAELEVLDVERAALACSAGQ